MDLVTISLDVLFLILAILVLPKTHLLASPPTENIPHSPYPSSPYLSLPHSGTSTPSHSPLPPSTPLPARAQGAAVPSITVTPHRPTHQNKRKSVSFSISSLDDLHLPIGGIRAKNQKRPPTPFVSGPVSPAGPGRGGVSPAPSMPGSPGEVEMSRMGHNLAVVDPMGVQKSWLMA